jgi:hypothetical protein
LMRAEAICSRQQEWMMANKPTDRDVWMICHWFRNRTVPGRLPGTWSWYLVHIIQFSLHTVHRRLVPVPGRYYQVPVDD